MMKKIVFLVILLFVSNNGFLQLGQCVEGKSFFPNPQNAIFLFANNHGIIWATRKPVSGTLGHRAISYKYYYYLQKDLRSKPKLIPFHETSTGNSLPIWVFENGSMVFKRHDGIIFVNPHVRANILVPSSKIRLDQSQWPPDPLIAGNSGVIMQTLNLNSKEPLFLVPWTKDRNGLDLKKKVLLTDNIGIKVRDPAPLVIWKNDYILSLSPPRLYIYNLNDRKLSYAVLKSYREKEKDPWWFPRIIAFDNETAIIRNESNIFGYNIINKEQFIISKHDIITIIGFKQNNIYMVAARDKSWKDGSYIFDLIKQHVRNNKQEVVFSNLGRSQFDGEELIQTIFTPNKLFVWINRMRQWKALE